MIVAALSGLLFFVIVVLCARLFRQLLVKIRWTGSIKWLASGYVAVLVLVAVIVSLAGPALPKISAEHYQKLQRENETLAQQFEEQRITTPANKAWEQPVDVTQPFILYSNPDVHYQIKRVPSLKNTVRGKIYYANIATMQADMSKIMPEPVIEIDDNFLDILFEKHGQVKMLTDRLNFINEQRLVVAQTSYASRIYVVLEVPTKLHMKKR